MAIIFTENPVFEAEEIRDTSVHNSSVSDSRGLAIKTIIIENHLNQTVTLQCQASAHLDFSNSFNVGNSFDVNADTDTYQTCESYFPYFRLTAICSTAPTSGNLTVLLEKKGA
jgi:hypothetical protein